MSKIDIRNRAEEVDTIVFADPCGYNIVMLVSDDGDALFRDRDGDCACRIVTKEDAENAILALQEAINRGWWES